MTGVKGAGHTVSIVCRGANGLVLDEAERSLHDAICVIRCLVKKKSAISSFPPLVAMIIPIISPPTSSFHETDRACRALIAGGGAPEIEIAQSLAQQALSLSGTEAICWKAFADAMEVIPTTLAENAGLNAIKVVTELRHRHVQGEQNAGVSIRSGGVKRNMADEKVLQPLLVSTSAVELAAETVKLILRIDDIALSR